MPRIHSDLYIMKHWGTVLNSIMWKRSNLMSRKCVLMKWILYNSQPWAAVQAPKKKKKKAVSSVLGTVYIVCCLWTPLSQEPRSFLIMGGLRFGGIWMWAFIFSACFAERSRREPWSCCLNWPIFKFLPLELNFFPFTLSGQGFASHFQDVMIFSSDLKAHLH